MTTERDPHGARKAAAFWMGGFTSLVESHAKELDALRAENDALRAEVARLRGDRDPTTIVPVGR